MDESNGLVVGREGSVQVVRMARPDRLNAFDPAQLERMRKALLAAELDPEIRAVILTGTGRAFSTGGDLKAANLDPSASADETPYAGALTAASTMTLIEWMATPVVAMVNGLAYAGGLALVLASDLALAAREAVFCVPEAERGLIDPYMPSRLAARVGLERAKWMIMTGAEVGAPEAKEWGLVSRVAPEDRLEDETMAVAESLARQDPAALRHYKHMMRRNLPEYDLGTYVQGVSTLTSASGIRSFQEEGHDQRDRP